VILALDDGAGAAARLDTEPGSPVSTDVEKCAHLPIAAPDDDDALIAQGGQVVIAGVGNVVGAAGTDPHLGEDALLLAGKNRGVMKVRAGQGGLERHRQHSGLVPRGYARTLCALEV
jgi:hypothetical protein